jgi:O-antigen/teichoic acid export membrane protein
MTQSLYYFFPRRSQRRSLILQTLLFLNVVGIVALALVLQFREELGSLLNNPGFANYAWPLGIYIFGLIGSTPLEVAQTAQGKTKFAATIVVVSDAIKAIAMTVPALLGWGLQGVMIGIALLAMARWAITWIVLMRNEQGDLWNRLGLFEQLRYSIPFGAAIAIAIPQQYFHQFVVSSRMDAATFALYAVGIFQLPIIDLLYTPTSEIMMVRIAELESEGKIHLAAEVFREAVTRMAQIFIPLSLFLMAIAPELITVLFTKQYLKSAPIFQVVALGGLLACFPVDGLLRARKETKHIFSSYVGKAIITVPLVLAGVSYWGMMGAVTAWLVAEIVGKLLLFYKVPRVLETSVWGMIPCKEWLCCLGVSTIALLGVWGVHWTSHFWPSIILQLILSAAGFASIYFLGLGLITGNLPFIRAIKNRSKPSMQAEN